MARASAQVSQSSQSRLLRLTLGAVPGTGAGAAAAIEGVVPRSRLPTSSITAVAAGGGRTGRASRGRSVEAVGAGTDATGGWAARRSWSNATSSSKRRTRCSSEGAKGVVSVGAWGGIGSCGFSVSFAEAGGHPSSAIRARAVSSSPFANGRGAGMGEIVSAAGSGGGGAELVGDSLGGTAFFLRAARSVLLFDIFTLALTPDPWGNNPNTSSIPVRRLLYQPAGRKRGVGSKERGEHPFFSLLTPHSSLSFSADLT